MRLRSICAISTMILLAGGFGAAADAKSKSAGGTVAPASVGGTTGLTGTTGSSGTTGSTSGTTGSTSGTTGATEPELDAGLAPITLAKDQSPTAVYGGPVFIETAAGLVPYSSSTPSAAANVVAGGTTATASSSTGTSLPQLVVPGSTAEQVEVDGLGLAAAPENAPAVVQEVIWAANKIIGRPYVYGGGHKSFKSYGYDCSGTVSYALHGGKLLKAPLDSSQFESWGSRGQGQWMTILTNAGHAYIDVAGLRLDTSTENDPSNLEGPRWRPLRPTNAGFVKRHPVDF